jgi:hypothetical protein
MSRIVILGARTASASGWTGPLASCSAETRRDSNGSGLSSQDTREVRMAKQVTVYSQPD